MICTGPAGSDRLTTGSPTTYTESDQGFVPWLEHIRRITRPVDVFSSRCDLKKPAASIGDLMTTQPAPRHRQRGQSTVEFMLMVPVLFSILFFVIEMGLYFTTVHYGTYAAYASARAQQVGFGSRYQSLEDVSGVILSGAIWKDAEVSAESAGGSSAAGVSIRVTDYQEKVPFPFLKPLMPNLEFKTSVYLGPNECRYEGVEERRSDQYDNNTNTCR